MKKLVVLLALIPMVPLAGQAEPFTSTEAYIQRYFTEDGALNETLWEQDYGAAGRRITGAWALLALSGLAGGGGIALARSTEWDTDGITLKQSASLGIISFGVVLGAVAIDTMDKQRKLRADLEAIRRAAQRPLILLDGRRAFLGFSLAVP